MPCSTGLELEAEINDLKKLLISTAASYTYNLHHPQVIEISQRLDQLIVKLVKQRASS
ncbi:aspartyl-phosphate phosphatase Spo0E family protein [Paenibacillus hexagrammi]|uniref:Aspartyl-phosphate phosphatase Spo0E family protein n=1 Tax=Paenibacillus hexagrammi TaxID=2908839 RepID=A0ABY3SMP8_9BACL|nr:aspartyl-phosphate phosphatase Spo0E family protein [Paenibacillus sp. YPD9-1]UJF35216.1 aspartyl-phosphate phosphatase Spo0E family protein [Paenibacillus sp. YPD9-1]